MCSRTSLNIKGQDIKPEILKRVVSLLNKNMEFVPLGLGEPLLYDGIFDLMDRVIAKKILVTNGVLLNERACKRLLASTDFINISLNATNEDDYKKYMGLNEYHRVVENIERLISLRKSKTKIYIQLLAYNDKDLTPHIKKWHKIMRATDKCYVHPVVNQGGHYDNKSKPRAKYPCVSPLNRLSIKINGDVYPCDPCFYSGYSTVSSLYCGNIMRDIKYRGNELLNKMRRNDYTNIPHCRVCDVSFLMSNCYFNWRNKWL
jgi:radical SAM protein with 4Fe4S-binding SPASM domain